MTSSLEQEEHREQKNEHHSQRQQMRTVQMEPLRRGGDSQGVDCHQRGNAANGGVSSAGGGVSDGNDDDDDDADDAGGVPQSSVAGKKTGLPGGDHGGALQTPWHQLLRK